MHSWAAHGSGAGAANHNSSSAGSLRSTNTALKQHIQPAIARQQLINVEIIHVDPICTKSAREGVKASSQHPGNNQGQLGRFAVPPHVFSHQHCFMPSPEYACTIQPQLGPGLCLCCIPVYQHHHAHHTHSTAVTGRREARSNHNPAVLCCMAETLHLQHLSNGDTCRGLLPASSQI